MTLFACDYSQCEVRILAHLSNDETLLAHFKDQESGGAIDIYREMAAALYGKSALEVTVKERTLVKKTTLAIMYGQGAGSVAKDLELTIAAANMFKDKFFKTYSRVKLWMDESIAHCRAKGYVVTISGRRRYLSDIHSKNDSDKARAERQTINSTIQGSAADLMLLGMVKVSVKLEEWRRAKEAKKQPGDDVILVPRLLLMLHDELIFEVPARSEEIQRLITVVKDACATEVVRGFNLKVGMELNMSVGKKWGSMRPVKGAAKGAAKAV